MLKQSLKAPLRTVLVAPFLIQTFVIVGLTGYVSLRNGQKAVNEVATQLRNEVSLRIQQRVATFMGLPQMVAQINANAVHLQQVDLQDSTNLERYLWYQMHLFKDLSPIAFGTEQGKIYSVDRLSNGSLVIRVLDESTNGKYSTYAADNKGSRAHLIKTSATFDPRNRPWYQSAVTAKEPIWTEIYPYFSSLGLAISAACPLYDGQTNALLGVTNATVSLSHISNFLHGLKVGRSGQTFIVERSGGLVASSTTEQPFTLIWENGQEKRARLLAIASRDLVTRLTAEFLTQRFGDFRDIDRSQQLEFEIDGQRQFLQITPFSDRYGLDWLIVVVVPEADFMERIEANTRATILLCVAALVVATMLGWATSYWIAQPILRLSRASQAIARGEINQHIKDKLPVTELEIMAQSFNKMSERLRQSFDQVKIALQESEEKFTKIFRVSPDPVAIVTLAEARFLEVNNSYLNFLGYSRDELIGQTSLDLKLWVDLDERERFRQNLREQGIVWNQEFKFRLKSGEIRTTAVSAELIEIDGKQCVIVISRDVSDRKQAEEKIKASLEEKEVLLKEIHHRVKNNLQIITSLLRLQSRSIQDNHIREIFKESENRVRVMALTHEKLYQSPDLANIDFAAHVEHLVKELMYSYGVDQSLVQLNLQFEEIYLSIDVAIPCGLIINELISNALKYAFPNRSGEISLACQAIAENEYKLTIRDNGVGLPDNLDINNSTSLGLRLVYSLTRQLNGAIEIDNSSGTQFTITFVATK